MPKDGIHIDIPGFGNLQLKALCSDYTGTLSHSGKLIGGVREKLCQLSQRLDIHVVTSDTRKTARTQLQEVPLTNLVDEIPTAEHDEYLKKLGLSSNEVRDAGGLAIAVDAGEGCAMEAMANAHVFVVGITSALDLLLDAKRLVGTLRTG